MGLTRVEEGDHVIGRGNSSVTGRRIDGKYGVVADVRDYLGDDVVTVTWSDGSVDEVMQRDVSGTQQGSFGRGQREQPEPSPADVKRAAREAKRRAKEEARRVKFAAKQNKADEKWNKRHGTS